MGKIVPLCMLQSGECGEVVDVTGAEHWVCRLAEKGLRLGCRLEMLTPANLLFAALRKPAFRFAPAAKSRSWSDSAVSRQPPAQS